MLLIFPLVLAFGKNLYNYINLCNLMSVDLLKIQTINSVRKNSTSAK